MLKSLTQEQFIALLLIQAAEIDFDFAQEEKEYILTFVSEADFLQLLFVNANDRIGCFKFLRKNAKDFFPSDAEQKELKTKLLNLFLADKSYNQFERTFMQTFRDEFIGTREWV